MFVVSAVLASPEQDRILKGAGAQEQGAEPHRPMRLERQVREETVIAKGNGKPDREEHHKKEHDLEPIDSKKPDIGWYGGQGEKQRADEKRTDEPVDSLERDSRKHSLP